MLMNISNSYNVMNSETGKGAFSSTSFLASPSNLANKFPITITSHLSINNILYTTVDSRCVTIIGKREVRRERKKETRKEQL